MEEGVRGEEMICPCGQPLEDSQCHYTIRHYNEKNEVIYELCVHGHVIIDKGEVDK